MKCTTDNPIILAVHSQKEVLDNQAICDTDFDALISAAAAYDRSYQDNLVQNGTDLRAIGDPIVEADARAAATESHQAKNFDLPTIAPEGAEPSNLQGLA
ncbi:hypothetical protein [Mesorhizobium sp.]|uniref:hypothetical protein n=1 Tax=Mesorhizobium sp. TaxID=1871066 RepID=UPI0025E882E0|nr:hypothetical protein [Mesorhizobium sp.]